MNILFIDLLCPEGHKDINLFLLEILNEIKDIKIIDTVFKEGYLNESKRKINKTYFFPEKFFNYKNNLDSRLKNIKKIKWIFNNINLDLYNLVLISSYETISFSLAWRKKYKPRILIFNHNNIDELNDLVKRFFFKKIPINIEHIVYEKFIKDYLISLNIKNKIWINHHPLDITKRKNVLNNDSIEDKQFFIFAPSGSNDDKIIRNLINNRKRKNLIKEKIKFFIKSKNINFEDEQMKVTNQRISYNEYIYNFNKANLVALLFNENFSYRVSGVLFDSFVFKKKVLFSKNLFSDYYLSKYRDLGDQFKSIDEFIELINDYYVEFSKNKSFENKIFQQIYNDYSKEKIKVELENILKGKEIK